MLIPVDPTRFILEELEAPQTTRKDVAKSLALAIRDNWDIDWPAVTGAIVRRWSMSSLQKIKAEAWRIVLGKQPWDADEVPDPDGEA